MKKITLILALLVSASYVSTAAQKGELPSIKVISYNIRNSGGDKGTNAWSVRYPASALMIEDQSPDIIGIQEVLPDQAAYLKEVMTDYKCIGVGREDGKKEGEVMFVMYNKKTQQLQKWGTYWLSPTPDTPSKGWDAACYRTATWALLRDKESGKQYFFIDTHLDHIGTEARKQGLQLIIDKIAEINPKDYPMIIVGDFNMTFDDPSMEPMKACMKDARTTAVMSDSSITYNAWGKVDKQCQIDFIWYKGFSSCTEFETIRKHYFDRTFISDHFPIKANLIF